MTPVIQARVFRTNAVFMVAVKSGESSISASHRADGWDGWEVNTTFNIFSDDGGVPLKEITPTIWPVQLTNVTNLEVAKWTDFQLNHEAKTIYICKNPKYSRKLLKIIAYNLRQHHLLFGMKPGFKVG